MNIPSDNALMMSVKNGDLDQLGLLFERYHQRLFGFFYGLTSQREVSEDLVQGVFERILKYRHSYSEDRLFSAWIFGIARNHHTDHYRKTKGLNYLNTDTNWEQLSHEDAGVEVAVDEVGGLSLVQLALDRLEPEKKQLLVLSRFEGFKYREIAAMMSCSESAVKVRVFRALKEIKQIICTIRTQEQI